ncbi:MAG: hypothetical protein FJ293_04500, partial [Planctomycetes bacterium]|nr:hypothetical protein [Planctomycetota bacterium]
MAAAAWALAGDPAAAQATTDAAAPAAATTRTPLPWLLAAPLLATLLAAASWLAQGRCATRIGVVLAALLALASVAHLALTGKRHELSDVGTIWSLDDDMMITLRYARNLAAGAGLVWNPGEQVEGITNLLWALLLAPLHWLLPPERAAAGAIALDAGLLLALLAATARLARRLGATAFG